MKTTEEIKQSLIVCILRKLRTMSIEDLRQMYEKGSEICDKRKLGAK